MSRRLLSMGLLLSVGVNLGVLAMVFLRTGPPPPPPPSAVETPPPEAPGEPPGPPPSDSDRTVEPSPPSAPSDDPVASPEDDPVEVPPPNRPPPRDPRPDRPSGPPPEPERPPRLDPRPFDQRPGVALRLDLLADELGLEGEARDRFTRIQREFLRSAWRKRTALRVAEAEMRQELFSPAPDRARLAALQDRIGVERQGMETLLVETVLATREILDPTQEAIYMRVLGRLRQAAMSSPPRGDLRRPLPGDERPFRRRPFRRPPG